MSFPTSEVFLFAIILPILSSADSVIISLLVSVKILLFANEHVDLLIAFLKPFYRKRFQSATTDDHQKRIGKALEH